MCMLFHTFLNPAIAPVARAILLLCSLLQSLSQVSRLPRYTNSVTFSICVLSAIFRSLILWPCTETPVPSVLSVDLTEAVDCKGWIRMDCVWLFASLWLGLYLWLLDELFIYAQQVITNQLSGTTSSVYVNVCYLCTLKRISLLTEVAWSNVRAYLSLATWYNLEPPNWTDIRATKMTKKLILLSNCRRLPCNGCSEVYQPWANSLGGSIYTFDNVHEQHEIGETNQIGHSIRLF